MATLSSDTRTVHGLVAFAEQVPNAAHYPPHIIIREYRAALRMTQAQLAKRAGVPQSHLARIETGKVDPQLSTVKKIFSAMFCDLLIVPRMQRTLEDIIEERAKLKGRRNVARVTGTMALEKQSPDDKTIENLIRSEESRLLASPTSEIWAD